ncbi:tRNA lysidine(34) synthetase TilS [Kaarinaea lacus]
MLNITLHALPVFGEVKRFIVAYSGGLDSHVLLHALASDRERMGGAELIAIYVNHGLSPNSEQWAEHCEIQCNNLDVTFRQYKVDATPDEGESPEAVAREVRYNAFSEFMKPGDCLLTAHHQDDQAETLLIQLLRGAGPRGLAAMPVISDFASGWHARPMLGIGRAELEEYANMHKLQWVNDESNFDTGFDRNYLRHEVMPLLKQRFPSAAATLSRTSQLCAEAAELLAESARQDYRSVDLGENRLSVNDLYELGELRARNVLHQWFRDHGFATPAAAHMQRVWEDVVCTADDSCPLVSWHDVEVRRYRDVIYVSHEMKPHDASQELQWRIEEPLEITGLGLLTTKSQRADDGSLCLSEQLLAGRGVDVRFRQGGEEIQPAGRQGHHILKKLFQEEGIPPWERDRLPLLYLGDELIAVADLWIAEGFQAEPGSLGYAISWAPGAMQD